MKITGVETLRTKEFANVLWVRIHTDAGIIGLGTSLGVDYAATHSCYDPSPAGLACGACDSCLLRAKGFRDAGIRDPTRYAHPV